MPPVMLFDKIITLSVLHSRRLLCAGCIVGSFKLDVGTVHAQAGIPHSVLQSRNLLRANKLLGSFKLDVATVWAQTDHQFYHKWALLTDPEDPLAGPKGYLQVDLSVVGKGDGPRVPPPGPERDYDDIEANTINPPDQSLRQFSPEQSRTIESVANDFPFITLAPKYHREHRGLPHELQRLTREPRALPQGRTSVRKHSYAPVWNEQLVFTEMFPPLCQRIKVQLRDEAVGQHNVIGTHFIHLKHIVIQVKMCPQSHFWDWLAWGLCTDGARGAVCEQAISNEGEKGFLPTFGPTFVHLYGSPRAYSLLDEHAPLNAGLGEGVSYRARLLLAVRTEILDGAAQLAAPTEPELEPCAPVNEPLKVLTRKTVS
ncbi:Uncharacterized protein, isoform G [Gryllus bimaculatus]|nr:Uncharacterized protein, isoform G [Gryllus bimaculatus]